MKDQEQRPNIENPTILDRQKIEQASIGYLSFASGSEIIRSIQAPPLEGAKRARKY